MFRTVLLYIIRSFSLYTQQWYIFLNLFLEQNSTCFGQFICPSSGIFHCTHSKGTISQIYFWNKTTCFGQFFSKSSRVFHCTNRNCIFPQIYFWNKFLHVSDSSSVHHQEVFTVQTEMVYFLKFIFGIKLYMFRTVPLSIIRSSFTVHTAIVYFLKFIFVIKLYMFRTVPLSIIKSFSL